MKKFRVLCAILALLLILPTTLLLASCGNDSKPDNSSSGEKDPTSEGNDDEQNPSGDSGVTPSVTLPVNQEELTLYIGDSIKLTPSVVGLDSNAIQFKSSASGVADVAPNGTVVAIAEGSAVITCEIPNTAYKAFCIVTVKIDTSNTQGGNTNDGKESLTINTASATLTVGQTHQLIPTLVRPIGSDRTLAYSSSSSVVATVDTNGLITAKAAGTASITVKTTDGKLSATCIVVVNGDGGRHVKLEPTTLTLEVGDSAKLNASYITAISSDIVTLSYSSSLPDVATVDQDGNIIAKNTGIAVITVSNFNGTAHATCEVTVKEKPKATLTIDPTTLTLEIGQTGSIAAQYTPARPTDSTKLIYSSSMPAIAEIDQSGKITAKAAGSTIITVSNEDGSAKTTCTVTVKNKRVASLTLDKTTLTLNEGETFTLHPIYTPAGETDSRVLLYSTSNSAVATVDSNGKITAKSAGITNILVTNKEKTVSASCHIVVKANSGTSASLTLDIYKLSLTVGESKTLHTSFTPASENDSKKLLFSSSSPGIATVDENGKITGKAVGSAVITVTNETGSVHKECTVTVKSAPVKPEAPAKSGSFKTNTGTKLNLLVEWSLTFDEYSNCYYLTANVFLESYSIVCGPRTNLSKIVIGGSEFKFNTEALDYTGVKEKQKIFFATATVIYEEENLPETIGIEALWTFNGSYSGVSIPVLHARDTVILK